MLIYSSIVFSKDYFYYLEGIKIDLINPNFIVTKVVDDRKIKTNIGFTETGVANKTFAAQFSKPLETEVISFLNDNLNKQGTAIEVVVKTLRIYEMKGSETNLGGCEIILDFYIEDETGRYLVLRSNNLSEISGLNITKRQDENIANAFKMCLDELGRVNLLNTNQFMKIDVGRKIEIPDSINYSIPVFKEKLKTGMYETYYELKNNIPSITEEFHIDKRPIKFKEWEDDYYIIPKPLSTGYLMQDIWGFTYNDTAYISHQGGYFPLIIENNEIYFYGYGVANYHATQSATALGGLLGLSLAVSTEQSNIKKEKVKYSVNPFSGRCSFYIDKIDE